MDKINYMYSFALPIIALKFRIVIEIPKALIDI